MNLRLNNFVSAVVGYDVGEEHNKRKKIMKEIEKD